MRLPPAPLPVPGAFKITFDACKVYAGAAWLNDPLPLPLDDEVRLIVPAPATVILLPLGIVMEPLPAVSGVVSKVNVLPLPAVLGAATDSPPLF
jgi:hypothetical protein